MSIDLKRFDDNGVELIIDTITGESFASISGYARMSGKTQQAISKRCKKLGENNALKTAEIQTEYGIKLHNLISEDLITEWLIDDNPELAKQMLKLGVRMFMHKLAGYEIKSTAVEQPTTPQSYIDALKALVASEERKELLRLQNEQLEKENELLSEYVDELHSYSSIIRVAKFNDCCPSKFRWRELKSASIMMKLEVKKVPCSVWETKNLYHHDVWRYCYPNFMLPETTTLRLPEAS